MLSAVEKSFFTDYSLVLIGERDSCVKSNEICAITIVQPMGTSILDKQETQKRFWVNGGKF